MEAVRPWLRRAAAAAALGGAGGSGFVVEELDAVAVAVTAAAVDDALPRGVGTRTGGAGTVMSDVRSSLAEVISS